MDREARRKQFELIGAQLRLDQLDEERSSIIEEYPELAGRLTLPVAKAFTSNLVLKARLAAKQKRTRKSFDKGFQDEHVARLTKGEFVGDVARSIGVRESVLRNWATKRNVPLPKMPWDERVRRMQLGRGVIRALPEAKTSIPVRKAPTPGVNRSVQLGLDTLAAMPDDEAIHYTEIAKTLNTNTANVHWYLKQRRKAGHVKPGKKKGLFLKTTKGKKYQQKATKEA